MLLDGKHRLEANKLYARMYAERQTSMDFKEGQDDWAVPSDEIDVEYHTIPDGVPVKLYAASLSTKHGDRIKPAERKAIAREIMEENPDFTLATLAEYLGISLGSSHSYPARYHRCISYIERCTDLYNTVTPRGWGYTAKCSALLWSGLAWV